MPPKHGNVAVFIPHEGCPHQCSFCNQRMISGIHSSPSPNEVRSVLQNAFQEVKDHEHTEIAFFGGSFTAVPQDYMRSLLETADEFTGPGGFSGVRISTRPDAIDDGILSILREHRVRAIELGAQSMMDKVLTANLRGHTVEDVRRASDKIRKAGFSLGLQMMLGLYQEPKDGPYLTAEQLAALCPDTVRIYPTLVLKGTPLAALYFGNEYKPMGLREAVEIGSDLLPYFEKRGIRVIRMGLHASKELEEQMIAGPYHPAYRELCESRIYLRQAREALVSYETAGNYKRKAILAVNSRAVSKMIGNNKGNLFMLREYGNWDVKIIGDASVPLYAVKVLSCEA